MSSYWVERQERAKQKLTDKGIDKINEILKKYYQTCMRSVIGDFEAVYDKFLATKEEGKEQSPATLYSLDKYWQMQGHLKDELQKLGDKEAELLSKEFTEQYMSIYKAAALPSNKSFSTINKSFARQMINQIWCADGKTWSQRIWGNIARLQETLNESLISCVVTGKKTTELKKQLQERFGVSYRQANTLVRTEMSNIANQAAKQKYQDSGLTKYEFLGREETDGCGHSPDCHKLDGQIFLLAEMKVGVNAPPMHPNCRCSIAPVVFEDKEETMKEITEKDELKTRRCISCGKEIKKGKGRLDSDFLCDECQGRERKVKHSSFNYVGAVNPKTGKQEKMTWDDYMELYPEKFYDTHCTICGKKTDSGVICDECKKKVLSASFVTAFKKRGTSDSDIIANFLNQPYEDGYEYPKPAKKRAEAHYGTYEILRKKAETPYQKRKLKKMYDEGTLGKHVGHCIDCGEIYFKESTKANASLRCEKCKIEHRKKQKRESARLRRAKK